MPNCIFCNSQIDQPQIKSSGVAIIYCPVCGEFDLSERIHLSSPEIPAEKRHIYSGAIREKCWKGKRHFVDNLDDLLSSVRVPANPMEMVDKLLLAIEAKSQFFGHTIHIDCRRDYSLAYARNESEFFEIVKNAFSVGYVHAPISITFPELQLGLNLAGAKRLAELHSNDISGDQAFVAMWFDPSMDAAYSEGIAPALVAAGYRPMLIKDKEHNNKIDDEIFAEINKSGLLIADFTGHRPSVYFEAGYAKGLGRPVIFTCRDSDISSAHFDTRQYSHITWGSPEQLKERLIRRIEATMHAR